jgi:hypothetical protein
MDKTQIYEKIINYIDINKIPQANFLFNKNILKIKHMNELVFLAFEVNKDEVGKEIIKLNFMINNQGYRYSYSPFDFFCFICKNDHIEILFRIIEDSYFWKKDKVIFEPEYNQTDKQWLIATAGYIMCSLNKVKSLEKLCDKYNITKFDADKTHFFEIADKNNFEELFQFLINRYGRTVVYDTTKYYESSLYDLPIFDGITLDKPKTISLDNPMYAINSKTKSKNNIELNNISLDNISLDNPMYTELNKK